MTFIPIPNGISLCFDFNTAGQIWQFCLTLRKSAGAPSVSDLQDVADIGSAWWTSHLKGEINQGTTLGRVRATDMTVEGGPERSTIVNTVGLGTTGPMPLGTPVVVSLRTDKRGRSYRGRVYISGLGTNIMVSEVDVSSTFLADMLGVFQTLQSTLVAAGYDLVVASKQHNKVVTNPAETNEVTGMIIDSHLDSQRRRLAGRGA